jgi:hypothetical protein
MGLYIVYTFPLLSLVVFPFLTYLWLLEDLLPVSVRRDAATGLVEVRPRYKILRDKVGFLFKTSGVMFVITTVRDVYSVMVESGQLGVGMELVPIIGQALFITLPLFFGIVFLIPQYHVYAMWLYPAMAARINALGDRALVEPVEVVPLRVVR